MAEYTDAQLAVISKLGDLRKNLTNINQQINSCNKRILRISNERQRHQTRRDAIQTKLQNIAEMLEVEKEVQPGG